jgi:hypothetical protein
MLLHQIQSLERKSWHLFQEVCKVQMNILKVIRDK